MQDTAAFNAILKINLIQRILQKVGHSKKLVLFVNNLNIFMVKVVLEFLKYIP
jgi:hypothetical protein